VGSPHRFLCWAPTAHRPRALYPTPPRRHRVNKHTSMPPSAPRTTPAPGRTSASGWDLGVSGLTSAEVVVVLRLMLLDLGHVLDGPRMEVAERLAKGVPQRRQGVLDSTGDVGSTVRTTMPLRSSRRSVCVRTLWVTPSRRHLISLKRDGSSSTPITISDHLSAIWSRMGRLGQSARNATLVYVSNLHATSLPRYADLPSGAQNGMTVNL